MLKRLHRRFSAGSRGFGYHGGMWRLRTTSSFSLLLLAGGVLGTHWLSGLTAPWLAPAATAAAAPAPVRVAAARVARPPATVRQPRPGVHPRPVARVRPAPLPGAESDPPPAAPPPALVPLETPPARIAWRGWRGHGRGEVRVRVAVDGAGRVADAALAVSSGDAVLDAQALASVRGWRFAVPAGHPDGFSGELPMRFEAAR